jgi:hypothetical protein
MPLVLICIPDAFVLGVFSYQLNLSVGVGDGCGARGDGGGADEIRIRIRVHETSGERRIRPRFRREGFRNLYNLRFGIDAWSLLVDTGALSGPGGSRSLVK